MFQPREFILYTHRESRKAPIYFEIQPNSSALLSIRYKSYQYFFFAGELMLCIKRSLVTSPLGVAVGVDCLYKKVYLQVFECLSFCKHSFCPFGNTDFMGSGKAGPMNHVNHTSWQVFVTPTDCPKSIRNLCLIELFGGVLYCQIIFRTFQLL